MMSSAMDAFYSSPSLLAEIKAAQESNDQPPAPKPRPTSKTRRKLRRSSIGTVGEREKGRMMTVAEKEAALFRKFYDKLGREFVPVHKD